MSVNFIKSIFEGQDIKTPSSLPPSVGIEFNKKFTYFTFAKKLIEKYHQERKKLFIINFDVLFYKYISKIKSVNSIVSHDVVINHILNLKNKNDEKQIFSNILNKSANEPKISSYAFVIIGLDLLNDQSIHNFINITKSHLNTSNFNLFLFSLDSSSNNLTEYNEKKKDIIKSRLNFYLYEKVSKFHNNKNIIYMEVYSLSKLTKDIAIFEFIMPNSNSNNTSNSPLPLEKFEFDKISIYLKEFKDLFEQSDKLEEDSQPVSTFKLSLNEKELQAKNETVLPYLKTSQEKDENRIIIDQDDLNELYEEDPDGDLDI
jgi:hypothetical protein